MAFREERMSGFLKRGNKLIADEETPQAMKLIERGLRYYSGKIIEAIYPYEKADACLLVYVLRHLADDIEKNNPGVKELYEGMKKCVNAPSLVEVEKDKKPNRY